MKIKIILFLVVMPLSLWAGKTSYTSEVDWQKGKVISWGISKSNVDLTGNPIDLHTGKITSLNHTRTQLFYNSKEKAVKNAIKVLKSIDVDYSDRIFDIVKRDNTVKGNLAQLLEKNISIKDKPNHFLESICRVELKIGSLLKNLNISFPMDDFPKITANKIVTKYTSLIIDARGLKIKPMLLPVIYNETGLEVYSKNYVNPKYAIKDNLVTYVFNERQAMKNTKAGDRPYFCAAIDDLKGSPVISHDDISKYYSYKSNLGNLKKCRVIFIINR